MSGLEVAPSSHVPETHGDDWQRLEEAWAPFQTYVWISNTQSWEGTLWLWKVEFDSWFDPLSNALLQAR